VTRKQIVPALILCLLATSLYVVDSVYAPYPYYYVNVLVAYDEEFDFISHWKYGYSPETFAELMLYEVSCRFWNTFSVHFEAVAFTTWDSYDNPLSYAEMIYELHNDTGFESGMQWGSATVNILVGFTNQEIPGAYGVANRSAGVVLVGEIYSIGGSAQWTDNVLQHEMSHLYEAPEHDHPDLDCIMNNYRVQTPWLSWVPICFLTENWCDGCVNVIMGNRESWGSPSQGGGGGGDHLFTPDGGEKSG
jgi:hypothetical protein